MKGYYDQNGKGRGTSAPTGVLSIRISNLSEFNELIEKARKEAEELEKTINRLQYFDLKIDFSEGTNQIVSETAFHR